MMRSYLDGVRDGLRLANGKLEDMLEVAERLAVAKRVAGPAFVVMTDDGPVTSDELAARVRVEGLPHLDGHAPARGACLRCNRTYPAPCPDPWNCGK
jgi:hypothetical protein